MLIVLLLFFLLFVPKPTINKFSSPILSTVKEFRLKRKPKDSYITSSDCKSYYNIFFWNLANPLPLLVSLQKYVLFVCNPS